MPDEALGSIVAGVQSISGVPCGLAITRDSLPGLIIPPTSRWANRLSWRCGRGRSSTAPEPVHLREH